MSFKGTCIKQTGTDETPISVTIKPFVTPVLKSERKGH